MKQFQNKMHKRKQREAHKRNSLTSFIKSAASTKFESKNFDFSNKNRVKLEEIKAKHQKALNFTSSFSNALRK